MSESVISKINLQITSGEFVAIMGSSGSGKSTLLHLAGLLDRPTKGKIFFHQEEVSKLSSKRLTMLRNKSVGFVFQSFHLLARQSVWKNVSLPLLYSTESAATRKKKVLQAIEQVGLTAFAKRKTIALSGGQKQKTAIARAIVNRPDVLLADEPTGNLDRASREEVKAIFTKLHKEGTTILLVTHDPEVAMIAQRVLIMKDGLLQTSTNETLSLGVSL